MTTRIAPGVGANLLGQHSAERNQDATAYVGNLDPQVLFPLSSFCLVPVVPTLLENEELGPVRVLFCCSVGFNACACACR
jgi:hypothetical protein